MLMVFFRCGDLVLVYVLWGVGPIPKNAYEIQGQHCVALFPGSEISEGLHFRNLIFVIKSCRIRLCLSRVSLRRYMPFRGGSRCILLVKNHIIRKRERDRDRDKDTERERQETQFCSLCSLQYFDCRRVGGAGMEQNVLFGAG